MIFDYLEVCVDSLHAKLSFYAKNNCDIFNQVSYNRVYLDSECAEKRLILSRRDIIILLYEVIVRASVISVYM